MKGAPLDSAYLQQRPRTGADGGYRLSLIREMLDELDGLGNHAELVGIHYSPGQQQSVKVLGLSFFQWNVNRDLMPPVFHIPSLDIAVFWGDDHGGGARLI